MDWTALGVIASTVLALLALGQQWRDRRSNAAAAAKADERADRTEAIAQRSADAAERLAQAAPKARPSWRLTHFDGDTYVLTNAGNAIAYDVHISTPVYNGDRAEMHPDDAEHFMTVETLATMGSGVTVTWSAEPGGEVERPWKQPLPPKG